MYKFCKTCSTTKPISDFGRNAKSPDGCYFQCKSCRSEYLKSLYKKNPDVFKHRSDRWLSTEGAAEKARSGRLNHYQRNKEHVATVNAAWRAGNMGKRAALGAAYRNRKKLATPPWLTAGQQKQIEFFYTLSEKLSHINGVKMNVDHIVPVKGKAVCGLHVPWNLQVIPDVENFSKGNKIC